MTNGDLVKFGDHAAYVASIGNPIGTTVLNQYSTMRLREETVLLADAETEFGAAQGYYRVKTIGVTIQNSFAGGKIILWGWIERDAGVQSLDWSQGTPVSVGITQQVSGRYYEYRYWNTPEGQQPDRSFTLYPRLSQTYTATSAEYFDLTFQNSLSGGSSGTIGVEGATRAAPFDTTLYKEPGGGQPSLTVKAIYQEHSSIQYTFTQWGDGITTNPRSFQPTSSGTITANFSAKPNPPTNVAAGGSVGQCVVVSWNKNSNNSVTQNRIWRKPKHGNPVQVTTVSNDVQSWTDYDVTITGTSSDSLFTYSVQCYYSPSGTWSDEASAIVWATYSPRIEMPTLPALHQAIIPTSFSVGNYPNPFNPSTTISYTLPKDASIRLEVFDVMGRKVTTLVNVSRSPGYYSVVWNGTDQTGREVSSGVYLYQFAATPSNGDKVFKQSGKLVLTR
ncbi:MAG: FlgD immunoglobulin-like domain containing protein [Ignavibacteria bacterium]|nr:FlgD immunoglobulin-like domain containing protein [Ignavibacteria bacterium]